MENISKANYDGNVNKKIKVYLKKAPRIVPTRIPRKPESILYVAPVAAKKKPSKVKYFMIQECLLMLLDFIKHKGKTSLIKAVKILHS